VHGLALERHYVLVIWSRRRETAVTTVVEAADLCITILVWSQCLDPERALHRRALVGLNKQERPHALWRAPSALDGRTLRRPRLRGAVKQSVRVIAG